MGYKGNNLILYTLQNCIICNELKGKLRHLNIPYTEIIVDDGSFKNNEIGNQLEFQYETNSYPIIHFKISNIRNPKLVFLSKTDLEEQKGIYIFHDIEQVISKIKQIYEI